MKTAAIVALLKEGKKPLVKITGDLWDDSFGTKGMLARITTCVEHRDDTHELRFDYTENKDHNLSLQGHNWYVYEDGRDTGKLGTIFEAGSMDQNDLTEDVYFDDAGDVPVELAEGNKILAEYLESGSTQPYVEWLEAKLEELVPNAMKTWTDEI